MYMQSLDIPERSIVEVFLYAFRPCMYAVTKIFNINPYKIKIKVLSPTNSTYKIRNNLQNTFSVSVIVYTPVILS